MMALTLIATAAGGAFADVAPIDQCTMPGQPCSNALSSDGSEGKPGTCTVTTCTRRVPKADGGFESMSYECNRCVAKPTRDGGAADGGAKPGKPLPDDDDGCSVVARGQGASLGLIALALALLALRRRRRA